MDKMKWSRYLCLSPSVGIDSVFSTKLQSERALSRQADVQPA